MEKSFSKEYVEYIHSEAWKKKAKQRREMDGNKCAVCGSTKELCVHHRNYRNFMSEDVENDLITLCKKCHEYVHENKDAVIEGLIRGAVFLKIESMPDGIKGFYESVGLHLDSPKALSMAMEYRGGKEVLCIPLPEGGALVIPYSTGFYCEKDIVKMCAYAEIEFESLVTSAREIYRFALEHEGYVEELENCETQQEVIP